MRDPRQGWHGVEALVRSKRAPGACDDKLVPVGPHRHAAAPFRGARHRGRATAREPLLHGVGFGHGTRGPATVKRRFRARIAGSQRKEKDERKDQPDRVRHEAYAL